MTAGFFAVREMTGPPTDDRTSVGAPIGGGRRGLWYAIGRTPTSAELDAAPALYGVVVLNIWETAARKRLEQLDPSIVVLAYADLSSARSYDLGANPPAGITWAQATATPRWLATDTSGHRIEWTGFPGHWQTAVWDPSYQQAWTTSVTERVVAAGFDGVLADNAVSTLKWYSTRLLAGTSTREQTDAKLRDGVATLVERAGPALHAKGKLLVTNVSDGRLFPGRWAALSRWGGAMEENFAHFTDSTDESGFVTDWGEGGWEAQAEEVTHPGLSLAVTQTAAGDVRAMRYGYASLLVRGDADSFWQPAVNGDYGSLRSIPEQRWSTGAAREPAQQTAGGAWARSYEHVWAAVNPTRGTVTVPAPAGVVRLGPATGVVLRVPGPGGGS